MGAILARFQSQLKRRIKRPRLSKPRHTQGVDELAIAHGVVAQATFDFKTELAIESLRGLIVGIHQIGRASCRERVF